MVNASLNWASIVGIVLAICGAGLYFMRSFKPALARDYDVFFAAIGLLCGGILFFQGWRLDPILQFGQFLLAGTTVFFAYESVRLRGVATDQARRSSYFDDPDPAAPINGGLRGRDWDEPYDRFEESQPINRRFSSRDNLENDSSYSDRDSYQPQSVSRAAIPEQAVSRRRTSRTIQDGFDGASDTQRGRRGRFKNNDYQPDQKSTFGERRSSRRDLRRGSRPSANEQTQTGSANTSRQRNSSTRNDDMNVNVSRRTSGSRRPGASSAGAIEDAAFSSQGSAKSKSQDMSRRNSSNNRNRSSSSSSRYNRSSSQEKRYRDNSSRFDD